MNYEALHFKYANDVTSTQASFIMQKLLGRDKWPFIDLYLTLAAYTSDFTKYFVSIQKWFRLQGERNDRKFLGRRHVPIFVTHRRNIQTKQYCTIQLFTWCRIDFNDKQFGVMGTLKQLESLVC